MRPDGARFLRREQRAAWRGMPKGGRLSHQVETRYGRHQRLVAWIAEFSAQCAARRGDAA